MKNKKRKNQNRQTNNKRLILSIFSLFCFLGILGQEVLSQSTVMEYTSTPRKLRERLDGFLNDYQTFSYNPCTADEVRDTGHLVMELDGEQREIRLQLNDLRAPGSQRTITTKEGKVREDFSPVYTYKGYVAGSEDSMVRLLVAPDQLSGLIRLDKNVFFIESAARFLPRGNNHLIVIYKDTDIKKKAYAFYGMERFNRDTSSILEAKAVSQSTSNPPWYQVQIATEADGEFYQQHPNLNVNNLIAGYVNQLDGIWEQDLNLRLQITYQHVYTNPDTDNYNADYAHGTWRQPTHAQLCENAVPGIWEKFRDYWNQNKTTVIRDIAVLFTGLDLWLCPTADGQYDAYDIFGTAGQKGTICRDPEQAYVVMEEYPTNTVGLMAHEIGHSLNALHDSDYRCTDPYVIGPVLCGTVEAGSNYYSEASKSVIADFIAVYHSCLTPIEPDIAVYQGATSIPNNFSFAFPSTTAGVPISLLFTIKNTGLANLEIQDTVVSGTYFTLTAVPASLVYGGGSTTFKIKFLCNKEGTYVGGVTISSSDPDENPYTFNIISRVVRKTVTFQAVADAFVDQRYPNTNYGSDPILRVRSIATGYGAHTYLKFTVSGVPGAIKEAKILIKTGYTYFPSSHIYHMQDNTWGENTITWNNASLDFYTHFDTGSLNPNKWHDINVISMVNGNGTYTFGLVAADVPNLWYWSRESAYKPVLIVTY